MKTPDRRHFHAQPKTQSAKAHGIALRFNVVLIAILAFLVFACAEIDGTGGNNLDGSTPEQAIALGNFETSFEAIALEEEWIKRNHHGAEVVQQDLIERDGRTLDMITLKMPDDSIRVIYFTLGLTGGSDS